MKSFFRVIALLFLSFALHAAGSTSETSTQASQLYKEGHYAEALELWYHLANEGNTDPNLYFNIGSAESLLNHRGESVLAFEKAFRLGPEDAAIKAAIKKERSLFENEVIPVNPFFLDVWLKVFLAFFRPGVWALFGLISLMISLSIWLMKMKIIPMVRFPGNIRPVYLLILGLMFILVGILSFRQLHRHNEAIIMTECEFRQAASSESPLIRSLNPGEKIIITDQVSGWSRVRLLNLDEGWVNNNCLKKIEIGTK